MLLAVVLLAGGAWIMASRTEATPNVAVAMPQIGFAAPDFNLESMSGGTLRLSDLRGKVVMVNLWASWCQPCRAEMAAIDNVYRQYRDQGLEVVAVNTTFQDSEADARAFVKELGVTFPIVLDRDGAASKRYALQAMPSTFFVGRDGTIGDMLFGGPMTEALIVGKIDKLLAEP